MSLYFRLLWISLSWTKHRSPKQNMTVINARYIVAREGRKVQFPECSTGQFCGNSILFSKDKKHLEISSPALWQWWNVQDQEMGRRKMLGQVCCRPLSNKSSSHQVSEWSSLAIRSHTWTRNTLFSWTRGKNLETPSYLIRKLHACHR